ncbi:MAG: hypothetical protein ABSC03_19730, partial [Verrucomicrobiota bacterium]
IEAGCKTLIGSRCKQSGMFWGKPGAENILALRCIHSSRRLDQFWKERLNAQAARNDCLTLAEQPKNSVVRPIQTAALSGAVSRRRPISPRSCARDRGCRCRSTPGRVPILSR